MFVELTLTAGKESSHPERIILSCYCFKVVKKLEQFYGDFKCAKY